MPPMTLMVKPVSGQCNMRCRYCFYCDEAERRAVRDYGVMSLTTLENTLRRAMTYADGNLFLLYQGGEPTLAGEAFYREALRLEKRYNTRGIRVEHAIQTNGLAMTEGLLRALVEADFLFGVSLDGTRATHDANRVDAGGAGTWARAMDTLERIRAAGGRANVLCVVTREVARDAREVFQALARYTYLQFLPCMDALDGQGGAYSLTPEDYAGFLSETFELYERAMRSGKPVAVRLFDNFIRMMKGLPPDGCAMAGRCAPYFLVEADGSVFPCDFYALDAYRMGNVNDTTFRRMAKGEAAQGFLQSSPPPAPECRECEWFALCRGGCRRDRVRLPDGGYGASRWCGSYRAFFERYAGRLKALAEMVWQD